MTHISPHCPVHPGNPSLDRIEGVVLSFIDITERRHAELALRRNEERYRVMFEKLQEAAIEQSADRDALERARAQLQSEYDAS
ncbi:hypothetical protein [Aurantiacibacter hainanensis]|uniref:hypothetical protein n=1 Tax=Aurantiacibacter hainanensis TaxID=3076114 RepID=UPI0030C715F1